VTLPPPAPRETYRRIRKEAAGGAFEFHQDGPFSETPELEGISYEIEKIAEAVGPEGEPDAEQQARLFALQDARRDLLGEKVKARPEMEPAFSEVAKDFMKWWKANAGPKETNTETQKEATFRLFAGFWSDRPIRSVRDRDAAAFMDALRHTDPCYGRSPEARELSWAGLQRAFGDREKGLSPSTLNRHSAVLKALWDWAVRRGHCEGLNPFEGHRQRLRRGVNVHGYVAWEPAEIEKLFTPPPKRRDLHEVMVVAMHSGMRLNEIAALTWSDVRTQDGVHYFQVADAKTTAGNRDVPLHPSLAWLLQRPKAKPEDRLWPDFNPEGPGLKPGADASRDFSYFKRSKGFTSRTKAFHSFRKNVVGQWEALGVPQTEVAEVVGHEKSGMTFAVYGAGISLTRKAEIVAQIAYPKLDLKLG
jgi:integrase